MYNYRILAAHQGEHWAEPYYRAAADRHVDVPMVIRLDSPLTRGQVARLVAAFMAEKAGALDAFRLAEAGILFASSASSSASNSSSSSSTSVWRPVHRVRHPVLRPCLLRPPFPPPPARWRLRHRCLPFRAQSFPDGRNKTDAIADGMVRMNGETGFIRAAQIKLFAEVSAIKSIDLVKDDGTVIASLVQRTTADSADYKQIYEAFRSPVSTILCHRIKMCTLLPA